MEQLIKAAEDLKAAADALIEVATRPPQPLDKDAIMALLASDDFKEEMRKLIHVWIEHDIERRISAMEDVIEGIDEKLDDKIDDRVPDRSYWDNLDPNEVEEAVSEIQSMPDRHDLEEITENWDRDEYNRAVEMAPKVEALVQALDPLLKALDELRSVKQAA